MTHQLASNWAAAKLPAADLALCQFAQRLTRSPEQMSQSQISELKAAGFSDSAIHDATQVIGYFNYINRIADALNVDLEIDIHDWEKSVPHRGS